MADLHLIERRVDRFLAARGMRRDVELGFGKDGHVWRTSRASAVKCHDRQSSYLTERDAYIRLSDLGIFEISGFAIPELYDYDDDLWVIEMSIVARPFIVDFASARFDEPPDLIEDEGNTFEDFIRDRFGERANDALALYYHLASTTGIYLQDLHPQNIKF